MLNREHSLYESPYREGDFPSNLIFKSFGGNRALNFNILIREGAFINLESNIPV